MVEKHEVQQLKTVDYWKQLDDVIKIIEEITKDGTNTEARQEWAKFAEKFKKDENFNKAFTEYLIKNPDQLERLRVALWQSIQRLVEKIKWANWWEIPDEIKPLLNFLETQLWISLGNEHHYQVMQNSTEIATKAWLTWATFYSAELGTSTAGNGNERLSTSENGWEKEYIVKLNNNPDNFYKVKVDKEWNLCPLAEEISNKLVNKKWEAIKSQVLLSNNESCKKYLANKLPDEIKSNCVIWWDSRLNDYTLTSYGRTLTIEPMTIAWDWISKDLSRNLAFLNLTNYIRKFWDKYGNIDPDINKKLKIKWTKVDKEKVYIKKEEFWLKEAQDEEISRFKKYNNHEQWEDNWDKKKNNTDYRKIIFPTLQAKPAGSAISWRSELWAAWWPKPENNPTGSSERVSSSSGSGASETWRSEVSTWKPEAPTETWKLVEISSDLRWMSDSDFEAIQKSMGDKMFIEKKDDGKVSYNLEKTKDYLWTMRDKNWSELKINVAYISAIQILLNSSNEWDKIKIDWKFNDETKSRVKVFQENYNRNVPEWAVSIDADGFPWKKTIAILLDGKVLKTKSTSSSNISSSSENKTSVHNVEGDDKIPDISLSELKKLGTYDISNIWTFTDQGFVLKNWMEKSDSRWKYLLINWVKIYELNDNKNWVFYDIYKSKTGNYCFSFWQYIDWNRDWRNSCTISNWEKYVGSYRKDYREWQWTCKYKNWSRYDWKWKDGLKEWKWSFQEDWIKYSWEWNNGKIIKCTSYGNTISIYYDSNWQWYLQTKLGKKLYFTDPNFSKNKIEPYWKLANTVNKMIKIKKEHKNLKFMAIRWIVKLWRRFNVLSEEGLRNSTWVNAKTFVDWLNEYIKDV